METNSTYYIDLITRYLAGEAGGDDRHFLEEWLKASPENRKIFHQYREAWDEVERSKIGSQTDLDAEWKELEKKLEGEPSQVIPIRSRSKTARTWYAIAALALLIAIPVGVLLFLNNRPRTNFLEAGLSVKQGILPDGSSVTLNRGAVLEYPSKFRKTQRKVALKGEAYFEVKHDVSKPFVISSGNVNVEVLGTTFYVNTERADGKLEVILNSGKVAVYFSETPGNRVILTPGEKAEVSRDTRKIEKDVNDDPNWLSWKTGRLVFNNTPLGEIAQDLMRVYPVKIELTSPGISRCLVTATFENQSLESVLNVLKATLNVKITISGTTIMISGDACR